VSLPANSADPGPHMALIAVEPCGCTAMAFVLGYGHDDDAYREAAREAKRGLRIEHVEVDKWKAANRWHCADHPKGPPWWKSNGGKGRRPAEYAPSIGLGL
jgi:hypothetical protein